MGLMAKLQQRLCIWDAAFVYFNFYVFFGRSLLGLNFPWRKIDWQRQNN